MTWVLPVLLSLALLIRKALKRLPPSGGTIILKKPQEICSFLGAQSGFTQEALSARAIPNARLVTSFRLTNTFVSASAEQHKAFVREAKGLLDGFEKNWSAFLEVADQATQMSLPSLPSSSLPLHQVVQTASLATIIVSLLHAADDPAIFSAEDLKVVCSGISSIWLRSKVLGVSGKTPNEADISALEELNTTLRRLIPDAEKYPEPLNIVIPTWETLWRAVAACLVHVLEDDHEDLLRALQDMRNNPNQQFEAEGPNTISPQMVVLETLRLHPPVRHIRRATPGMRLGGMRFLEFLLKLFPKRALSFLGYYGPTLGEIIYIADLESALRCAETWGPDAHQFRPSRFIGDDDGQLQRDVNLAFGCGPLKCIAASWSKRAIAHLTIALSSQLASGTFKLHKGEKIGSRDGWEGWVVEKARE